MDIQSPKLTSVCDLFAKFESQISNYEIIFSIKQIQ